MGKLIALLVVVGLVFGGYWHWFHQSPAFITYRGFDKAIREGDCKTLYSMAEGKAKDWTDTYCQAAPGMQVMGQTISGHSAAEMAGELNASPAASGRRFRYEEVSEDSGADGTVNLVSILRVISRPSNFSNSGPLAWRQTVSLKQEGDAWKVTQWQEEEIKE